MVDMTRAGLIPGRFDRARLALISDVLAVAVAVSLPWSTSASSVLIALWLIALVPRLDLSELWRQILTPAGGLPVLLCLLAAVGMSWADVGMAERFGGLRQFHRLLMIPLLLAQFRESERGMWVVKGFLASCTALLALSWIEWLFDWAPWTTSQGVGTPIKNDIVQSEEFELCIFSLLFPAVELWRDRGPRTALALLILIGIFLADLIYIAVSRTALVTMPILLLLFGLRFGWKGVVRCFVAGGVIAGLGWVTSPYLRDRVTFVDHEVATYRVDNAPTSSGLRLEFWKKSISFIAEAPLIGHGTGSIHQAFRGAASGEEGASSIASENPHQQTLAVGIELGFLGISVLLAMWVAHVMLFRGPGPVAWYGLVVVVVTIAGCLLNSFLFDFTEGWIYVFGVGVLGGMVQRQGTTASGGGEAGAGVLGPIG